MTIVFYGEDKQEFNLIKNVLKSSQLQRMESSFFNNYSCIVNYINYFSDEQNIYFLSLEMKGTSGLEVARQIRKQDKNALIIFLANDKTQMAKVFEVVTFDYVVRPMTEKSLERLFSRIQKYTGNHHQYFTFFSERLRHSVLLSEIVYFEKCGRAAYLYTEKEVYKFNQSMCEIFQQLSEGFVQVHCSYIVNLAYVMRIRQDAIILKFKDGNDYWEEELIPVGRSFKSNVKRLV